MRKSWLLALVASLALSGAACRKDNKAQQVAAQVAALDSAYQSGVLTKAEYDAKRQALLGKAADAPAPPVQPAVPPQQPVVPAQTTPPQTLPAHPAAPPPDAATAPPPPPGGEPEPAPLAGCADTIYRNGKEKGERERFYPAPVEAVKRAAIEALRILDFTVHSNAGNTIEATKRRGIGVLVGAGGERLILRFEPARRGGQAGTVVVGETRKSFVGRVAQRSWTNALLAQIACYLRVPH
jgi:hypothetical protein